MSRQDKATTDRNAKTLRELVKLPENKVCADCKRNDPRWASWNLGVFVCIRCSGIHRSMGTHISKVKSVDLDVWTPEQMLSVQKWGNHRANLYWEAHLKAGHIPPDHKMESFIRSKYESRRWAMEGPVPSDPSVLESGSGHSGSSPLPPTPPPQTTQHTTTHSHPQPQQRAQHTLLSTQTRNSGVARSQPAQPIATLAPPPGASAAPAAPAPVPEAPKNDIFELDFHAPAAPAPGAAQTGAAANKNVKADILSLFSTPAPNANAGAFGAGFGANAFQQQAPQQQQQQQQYAQPQSMMGATGWGVQPQGGGWSAPAPSGGSDLWGPPAAAPVTNLWSASGAASNPWAATAAAAQPAGNNPYASAQNPWGGSSIAHTVGGSNTNDLFSAPFSSSGSGTAKKDDAFGDLWSTFK